MKQFMTLVIVVLLGVAGYLLFLSGPRMYVQPSLRTYQVAMPPLPSGVVAVQRPAALPSVEAAKTLANPLARTKENLARGQVYYGYNCRFCHGADGAGDGPVGQSYVPRPADLRSARLRAYTDGQLLRAMLLGIGHEPVLARVVAPVQRWYLVLYVRSLAADPPWHEGQS